MLKLLEKKQIKQQAKLVNLIVVINCVQPADQLVPITKDIT